MVRLETELMKEMRSLRRGIFLILRRQDLMLKAFIPEAKPTKEEIKIIAKKKEFGSEKDLFKALR
jgi:hypothetical protein